MLPFIFGGIALVAAGSAAVYKKYTKPKRVPSGKFAIWGRPNCGKTTFISKLRQVPITEKKVHTSARSVYTNIPPVHFEGRVFQITEIVDMPGTSDRRDNWLKMVVSHDHIFYLLNLSFLGAKELAVVRADLASIVLALRTSGKTSKKLHVIASHVDESHLKCVDVSQLNNVLMDDEEFRRLYEVLSGISGYVYAANLIDDKSFSQLLTSIMKDIHA